MAIKKNNKDQLPFLAKAPKTGSNNTNVRTVKIALPNSTFSPKPTGNISINGAIINKAGIAQMRFTIQLDLWLNTKNAKATRPKYTGIIKNPAPRRLLARKPFRTIQNNSGIT